MTRRGEAWCGEVRCGGMWQSVKVWKMGFARPRPGGPSGLALLKGVDLPSGSARTLVGASEPIRAPQTAPRCVQDAAKTAPRRSKTLQDGPTMTPRRLKTLPRWPKTAPSRPKKLPRRPQDAPRGLQDEILVGFWCKNGAKLTPESHPEAILC